MRNRLKSVMTVLAMLAVVAFLSLTTTPTAGQAPAFKTPRTADGKPDLNGIWEALGTANWDLQTHAARPAQAVVPGPIPSSLLPAAPVLALGARGGIPGGMGVVEGEEIPYKREMLAKKKENFDNSLTRDPEVKCYLPGIPRATYMPYPFQIAQSTNKIMVIYEFTTGSRTIHLDEVPPPPTETWMGHSLGRWEGDTLVVDVTSQVEQTWFDRAGNFHSDALHVIERYTPTSPDHLNYEATIDDPKVFTRPWKIQMPLYRRVDKNAQLMEYKCVEFVEELMYGQLRKRQIVRRWEEDLGEFGGKITIDVTRKVSQ